MGYISDQTAKSLVVLFVAITMVSILAGVAGQAWALWLFVGAFSLIGLLFAVHGSKVQKEMK